MQFTTAFLTLAAASLALAACPTAPPAMPECAGKCIMSVAMGVGCTGPTDFACQCKNSAQLSATAGPCILSACGTATAAQVSATAASICSACNS